MRVRGTSFLVTGGSGFVGAALVRRLVALGGRVRVLDNNSRGNLRRLREVLGEIEFIEGDIRDAQTVCDALAGIDCVWHLAYINGTRFFYEFPERVLDVAVKGMVNVLDGARAHGVRECFLASSSEVYHEPRVVPTDESAPLCVPDALNPRYSYSGGKLISELLALHAGDLFERVVVFRPHNVYGIDMGAEHVIPEFVTRLVIESEVHGIRPLPFAVQGTGEEIRSFVHVDDLCDGLALLYEHAPTHSIYHVGNDEAVPIATLARKIAALLNIEITIDPGAPAPGGPLVRCPDITKLRGLGYRPKISLDSGLPAVVDWYRELASLAPQPSSHAKVFIYGT
jgi:nucleoside-diphosphate-sugar epimerase